MKGVSGILLVLLLVSCETNMTDDDWSEHDPKLVIVACVRIKSDSVYVYCRVSRTMGLGEKFSIENAMVDDAEVKLFNDGMTHDIPHRHEHYKFAGDVNYFAVFPRGVSDAYTLTVRKGDLNASSSLRVRTFPLHMESQIVLHEKWGDYTDWELHYLTPVSNVRLWYHALLEEQCADSNWQALPFPWGEWDFLAEPWTNQAKGIYKYTGYANSTKARYTLRAHSSEYSSYRDSRYNHNYSGSPFEPQAKNPPFNITGDGIGFFWYELVGEPVEIPY